MLETPELGLSPDQLGSTLDTYPCRGREEGGREGGEGEGREGGRERGREGGRDVIIIGHRVNTTRNM